MPSRYEAERLVGILLRRIVGSIVRFFRKSTLPRIYQNTKGDLTEIDENCMEWRDIIARFLPDDKKKKMYADLLIIYQDEKIDPDKDELWKLLMKRDLPDNFYKRFEEFGQIPQVASLDISEPTDKVKEKDIEDVNW